MPLRVIARSSQARERLRALIELEDRLWSGAGEDASASARRGGASATASRRTCSTAWRSSRSSPRQPTATLAADVQIIEAVSRFRAGGYDEALGFTVYDTHRYKRQALETLVSEEVEVMLERLAGRSRARARGRADRAGVEPLRDLIAALRASCSSPELERRRRSATGARLDLWRSRGRGRPRRFRSLRASRWPPRAVTASFDGPPRRPARRRRGVDDPGRPASRSTLARHDVAVVREAPHRCSELRGCGDSRRGLASAPGCRRPVRDGRSSAISLAEARPSPLTAMTTVMESIIRYRSADTIVLGEAGGRHVPTGRRGRARSLTRRADAEGPRSSTVSLRVPTVVPGQPAESTA